MKPSAPAPRPVESEEAIFSAALAYESPAARAAYLDAACAGHPELRRGVEALLNASEGAPTFLDRPPVSPGRHAANLGSVRPPNPPADEGPGTQIGRYKLLEKIGEGGFGEVYVAEQREPVKRKVALKIIKLGMDTRQVIARFEAERQALAMMDHPNIAKVLDGGMTEAGRPYFVMELVRGHAITRYCDENHLTAPERLQLFILVCHAIQHAHQKGIIHRDIKPSNILVTLHDGVPVPKVIDFGIAKATQGELTDKTLHTQFQQFIGTPAYVSPEQAEMSGLDIDTRSDIYALGVLLYELLVGRTPFDGREMLQAGLDSMRQTIREIEPVRPSTRLSSLEGEERTSIAKRRGGADVTKLAADLRGDVDWIVMKCLEKDRTRRYETANGLAADITRHLTNEPVVARPPSAAYKFQKAWRRNQTAFTIAALFVLVLVTSTLVSVWQANRARERLIESEAVSQFLTGVFQSPDPAQSGHVLTVPEMLGAAAKRLDTNLTGQPARRAKLQNTLGLTYYQLGLFREAIPLQEQARDYRRAALGPKHPDTLLAMHELANSYGDAGRSEEALRLRDEVLKLRREVLGAEHPDTLKAMGNLGNSYFNSGRRQDALRLREEVLMLSRKVNGPEHPETLKAMHNLALSCDPARRLSLRTEVLTLSSTVNGPEHPLTLMAMQALASSYADSGRHEEALTLRKQVLALSSKVNGPQHPHTLGAMQNLATTYGQIGRPDEALKMEEELLAIRRKASGPEHPDTLKTMVNLGNSYSATGRKEDGIRLFDEVLALFRKINSPEHPDTLLTMYNLAIAYRTAGRTNDAVQLGKASLEGYRRVVGSPDEDTFDAMRQLAFSYEAVGDLGAAIALKEESLTLIRKLKGPENPQTLNVMYNLAITYGNGRPDEAIKLWEQLLPLSRKAFGPEKPETLSVMFNLATSYSNARRWDQAIKLGEQLLPLSRKVIGPENIDTLKMMYNLAITYGNAGRRDEAIKLLEQLLPLSRKVNGPESIDTFHAMQSLAASYGSAGRRDEARKLHEELLPLSRKVNGPEHSETLWMMINLANIDREAGRGDEAIQFGQASLEGFRRAKGRESEESFNVMTALAISYRFAHRLG